MTQQKSPIPKLSKDALLARAFRIKPLKADDDGTLHFIKPCDIETVAFAWDPERVEKAKGLTPLRAITTVHSYGAPSFFKPDISEVLAQIPPELLDRVSAFTTEPDYDNQFTQGGSYHRGVTTLYEGPLPEAVRAAPVIYKKKEVFPPEPSQATTQDIAVMKPIQLKKGPQP
ncbi:MAG: hypothetical protein EPN97_06805 [Alphaproteobacteria bacterium]|nr:MAG: hypothetical protein EPN97_06805 [Alphaproteobacteria bacterium]